MYRAKRAGRDRVVAASANEGQHSSFLNAQTSNAYSEATLSPAIAESASKTSGFE
jgi:hypothetical protein